LFRIDFIDPVSEADADLLTPRAWEKVGDAFRSVADL
jgi:hypothetical protein